MIRDLLPFFFALALAVLIYIARERRRRRTEIRPRAPELTMREAWRLWWGGLSENPDVGFTPTGWELEQVDSNLRAEALRALLDFEQADNTRQSVRRAILESAAMALHLECILRLGEPEKKALLEGYRPELEPLENAWRGGVLRWMVLRRYASLKYDDAVSDDWFHYFMHAARPYVREKIRVAREFVLQMDEGAGRIARIYDALLDELQKDALKAPPKKRFVRPDLP
jgi:hypothetical protein